MTPKNENTGTIEIVLGLNKANFLTIKLEPAYITTKGGRPYYRGYIYRRPISTGVTIKKMFESLVPIGAEMSPADIMIMAIKMYHEELPYDTTPFVDIPVDKAAQLFLSCKISINGNNAMVIVASPSEDLDIMGRRRYYARIGRRIKKNSDEVHNYCLSRHLMMDESNGFTYILNKALHNYKKEFKYDRSVFYN